MFNLGIVYITLFSFHKVWYSTNYQVMFILYHRITCMHKSQKKRKERITKFSEECIYKVKAVRNLKFTYITEYHKNNLTKFETLESSVQLKYYGKHIILQYFDDDSCSWISLISIIRYQWILLLQAFAWDTIIYKVSAWYIIKVISIWHRFIVHKLHMF